MKASAPEKTAVMKQSDRPKGRRLADEAIELTKRNSEATWVELVRPGIAECADTGNAPDGTSRPND